MVAITVILAAVIGTFVLGLGDQLQSTTPQASFGFDQSTTDITAEDLTATDAQIPVTVTSVTITHESGDTLDANDLAVKVDGKTAYTNAGDPTDSDGVDEVGGTFSGDVSAGSSISIVAAVNDDSVTTGAASGDSEYVTNDDGELDIDYNGGGNDEDVKNVGLSSGETVRIIYDSPDSDSSSTLGKYEIQ